MTFYKSALTHLPMSSTLLWNFKILHGLMQTVPGIHMFNLVNSMRKGVLSVNQSL